MRAGIATSFVLLMGASAAAEPLSSATQTDHTGQAKVGTLVHEDGPVIAHLDALKAGTITNSLADVGEQVAIFSADTGKEPYQVASGRRSVLPLYVISFGTVSPSITSYQCVDRTSSTYCTFILKKDGQPSSFALEFWVDDQKISKILKWHNIQSATSVPEHV